MQHGFVWLPGEWLGIVDKGSKKLQRIEVLGEHIPCMPVKCKCGGANFRHPVKYLGVWGAPGDMDLMSLVHGRLLVSWTLRYLCDDVELIETFVKGMQYKNWEFLRMTVTTLHLA